MIDLLNEFIDIVLHIDIHIQQWVTDYRTWTYLILFVIVFMETGFVVTPFLPGDSLLFAAGAVAAMPNEPLSLPVLIVLMLVAAFGGDNTNYLLGRVLGQKVYEKNYRFIKREYLDKTHAFYAKHGGKTIIIARFMPIIRTFAPFVAGVGTMRYIRFISFSIVGNILWVLTFCLGGYFFGSIPLIKKNFSVVIVTIIIVSLLPMVIAFIKSKMGQNRQTF
ncbi:MAG: DedA family protein [Bacteroidales bacterium]|jgi:membrane-associated protein|nr:DedA family protein [Bacteroidales bacterium]